MKPKILVVVEHWEGQVKPISWEAIELGRRIAEQKNSEINLVICGYEIENLAAEISEKTGLEILTISDKHCNHYNPEVYCDLLQQVIWKESPFLVLMGHSYQAIDYVPKLATMLDAVFIPNCIDYRIEADRMIFERSVYGGKLTMQMEMKGDSLTIISLQPGRFKWNEINGRGLPKVVKLDIQVSGNLVLKRKVLEIIQGVHQKIDLTRAEIIVAGGRGLGSKENFQIIFDLAKVFGASVGASRPVIDEGWASKEHQLEALDNQLHRSSILPAESPDQSSI